MGDPVVLGVIIPVAAPYSGTWGMRRLEDVLGPCMRQC